jgi:hypothetical protein
MARSPLRDSLAKRDHLYSEKVTDDERKPRLIHYEIEPRP